MATDRDLERTYGYMESFVVQTLDPRDITCARFDGNYHLTLAQAQQRKHNYIFDRLGLTKSKASEVRFLDVGCGYGSLVEAAEHRGALAEGITLERGQARFCRELGLFVYFASYKQALPVSGVGWGKYNAIACAEAMEHFCTPQDFIDSKQEEIYQDFFAGSAEHLFDEGRMYVQVITLGKNAPNIQAISLDAPKTSREYMAARVMQFYPNSWPPQNADQLINCASPYFDVLEVEDGTEDYIETMRMWSDVWKPTPQKALPAMSLAMKMLVDSDLRMRIGSLRAGYQRQCFQTGVVELTRMLLQKRSPIFIPENADKISSYLVDRISKLGIRTNFMSLPDYNLDVVYLLGQELLKDKQDAAESMALATGVADIKKYVSQIRDRAFDNAVVIVNKAEGQVFVHNKSGLVEENPNSDWIAIWNNKEGKRVPIRFTQASSKQLNSFEFWETWGSQFMSVKI